MGWLRFVAPARSRAGARADAHPARGLGHRNAGGGESLRVLVQPAGVVAGTEDGASGGAGLRRRGRVGHRRPRVLRGSSIGYGGGCEDRPRPHRMGGDGHGENGGSTNANRADSGRSQANPARADTREMGGAAGVQPAARLSGHGSSTGAGAERPTRRAGGSGPTSAFPDASGAGDRTGTAGGAATEPAAGKSASARSPLRGFVLRNRNADSTRRPQVLRLLSRDEQRQCANRFYERK